MILLKLLQDWKGHNARTYQYFDEIQADLLIKRGIAEAAYIGETPELPRNYKHVSNAWSTRRT